MFAGDERSGAAAFVEIWAAPFTLVVALGGARSGATGRALELGDLMFLPVWPFISRLFGVAQRQAIGVGANRG